MTHYDRSEFRRACRARLATVTDYPGHTYLEWEGREWTRQGDPTNGLFVREHTMPIEEANASTGLIVAQGRMHYDVWLERGRVLEPAEALAKNIAEEFAGSQGIVASGFEITIYRSERGPLTPVQLSDFLFLPVSFRWLVTTPK